MVIRGTRNRDTGKFRNLRIEEVTNRVTKESGLPRIQDSNKREGKKGAKLLVRAKDNLLVQRTKTCVPKGAPATETTKAPQIFRRGGKAAAYKRACGI